MYQRMIFEFKNDELQNLNFKNFIKIPKLVSHVFVKIVMFRFRGWFSYICERQMIMYKSV